MLVAPREMFKRGNDDAGGGDEDNSSAASSSLCVELETLAALLLRDESCSERSVKEGTRVLKEAISMRQRRQQVSVGKVESSRVRVTDRHSANNNNIILMNDLCLLSMICEERDSESCDSESCEGEVVLQQLQALETNAGFSEHDQMYFLAFVCPKLGMLLEQRGNMVKSFEYFQKAIPAQRMSVGECHSVMYQTLLDFGLAQLQPGGSIVTAEELVKESARLRLQFVHGSAVHHTSLSCLADGFLAQLPLYWAKNDVLMCKALVEKAYFIRRHLFGASGWHTSLAECLVEYGVVCKAMRRHDLAVLYFEESLKVRGKHHVLSLICPRGDCIMLYILCYHVHVDVLRAAGAGHS